MVLGNLSCIILFEFAAVGFEVDAMFKDNYMYFCLLGVIILLCNNPGTLLIRPPDKRGIEDNSKIFFSYFSMKTYVLIPH